MEHIVTILILAFTFTGILVALIARTTRRRRRGNPDKTSGGDAAGAWFAVHSGASSAGSDGGGCDGGFGGADGGGAGGGGDGGGCR